MAGQVWRVWLCPDMQGWVFEAHSGAKKQRQTCQTSKVSKKAGNPCSGVENSSFLVQASDLPVQGVVGAAVHQTVCAADDGSAESEDVPRDNYSFFVIHRTVY
ncbi:hypothetical protein HBI56_229080 [Parastagonospora nodorum]|uniref:Uncharacterized protein n=1 Tax=Phaeosphaeria nodorum (strain SN15 / ATCC MYA-4574 / FGSC 10173) TaxID=321614 RepID=A0A7U2FAZ2_PHANO|nr:hypothetical protein HBH56_202040 [Parastagonospora nodorum]QRD00909.1 hypothetical protein JI435_415960 [Parastagonospora nodorum SN15]KAH3925904.1 hypothetical protein HBH54_174250 [Parastagonospora nodorum]KAH3952869.1 hypothetical protein HBH53_035620 [Parastagonospora nodorum]KAH3976564.1 hypothetical protein HBH52_123040 [Parastagonospora nodorum]